MNKKIPSKVQLKTNLRNQSISAAEIVVMGIKQQLVDRRLQAGDRLPPEAELCSLYGVGRSSLREAIRTLRAQGILDLQPGVGTFVSDGRGKAFHETLFYNLYLANPKTQEIEELRMLLEIDVMELIIRNYESNAAERRQLYERLKHLETLAQEGCENDVLLAEDMAFHKIMAAACKNHVISSLYRTLIDYIQSSMADAYPRQPVERIVESHHALLSSIDSRSIERVRESVEFSLAPWREHSAQ